MVQDWLWKKYHLFKKKDNLANLPEACPIEDFWSILEINAYEDG